MLLKADFFCRKISNCWNELPLLAMQAKRNWYDSDLAAIQHRACPAQIHPSWPVIPVLITVVCRLDGKGYFGVKTRVNNCKQSL